MTFGGFRHRAGYALTRIFVTPTDAREAQFNYSEFGGNAAQTFGLQLAIDTLGNVGKEFWPDVKSRLTGMPIPDP